LEIIENSLQYHARLKLSELGQVSSSASAGEELCRSPAQD
jgi:hypothetical protein